MDKIKLGFLGLGQRGRGLITNVLGNFPDVDIVAVCDEYKDRTEDEAKRILEARGTEPAKYLHHSELLSDPNVNTVIISASWEAHIPLAIEAMKKGKICGLEVGGGYSVDDCWQLVRTWEETKTPFMFLENCCYGKDELIATRMVRQGKLGEVVYAHGSYCHDLRWEICSGVKIRHYRLRNYMHRNCENYPTHELGPIAKVLNINRGNRMVSLTATASCSRGLNEFLKREKGDEYDIANYPFAQGDVVTTVIKCAHGETIVLTLDTTLPRYYSRNFTIRGTRGMYSEEDRSIFIDGVHNKDEGNWQNQWGNADQYRDEYEHPIWRKFINDGIRGGHGGMDALVFDAFFTALMEGQPVPIDVYDMAAWMSISALSEESIALGGAAVAIPDFTNGQWLYRDEEPDWEFCLSKICE